MNKQINRHKAYLQRLSQKQVKATEIKHKEATKDLPIRQSLPEFKEVRKRIVITDYDFGEKEYVFELLYYKHGRTDQYLIKVNGQQLYYNRRGKIVLNPTPNPVIMGLHEVYKLAMSKFHRIRRI